MFGKLKKIFYLKILRRKYYRVGKCQHCGKCCRRIYVKTYNHVITDEKEFNKLRYLHIFYSYLKVVGKDDIGLVFECSNYDKETHLCKIHKKRPSICRRYPQEEMFTMGGDLSENCGYKFIPIESFSEVFKKVEKNMKNKKN